MTEKIQDPELRDFIEESIIKCFHFLNSGARSEKCEFSQNLASCLAMSDLCYSSNVRIGTRN